MRGCIEFCTDERNEVNMSLITEIFHLARSTLEVLRLLNEIPPLIALMYIFKISISKHCYLLDREPSIHYYGYFNGAGGRKGIITA